MDPNAHLDQQLLIRMVIERYFSAVDLRDFALLATCFTKDTEFEFNLDSVVTVKGRDALVERFGGMPAPLASSHAMSNCHITVRGAEAQASTFAIVHAVLGPIPDGPILVRGLRYDDMLAREDGAWRIAKRRHFPLWQYETVAVSPRSAPKSK